MYDYDINERELAALRAIWEAGATNFGDLARRVQYERAMEVGSTAISELPSVIAADPDRVMDTDIENVIADLEELGYLHVYDHPALTDGPSVPFVWLPVFVGWMLDDLKDGLPTAPSTNVDKPESREFAILRSIFLNGPQTEAYLRSYDDEAFNAVRERYKIERLHSTDEYRLTSLGQTAILRHLLVQFEAMQGD